MTDWKSTLLAVPESGQRCLVTCGRKSPVIVAEYWVHDPGVHDGDSGFYDDNGDEVFPVHSWAVCPKGPEL